MSRRTWFTLLPLLWLVASCGSLPGKAPPESAARAAKSALSGTITYRPRVALTPKAIVRVWLQDMSEPKSPVPVIVDAITLENPGQVPIAFTLRYDPQRIVPERRYTILVKIYEGDRTRFVNAKPVDVLTRGCPANCEIVVDLMN